MKFYKIFFFFLFITKNLSSQDTIVNKNHSYFFDELHEEVKTNDSLLRLDMRNLSGRLRQLGVEYLRIDRGRILLEIPNKNLFNKSERRISKNGKLLLKVLNISLETVKLDYSLKINSGYRLNNYPEKVYDKCISNALLISKELILNTKNTLGNISLGSIDNREGLIQIVLTPIMDAELSGMWEPLGYDYVDNIFILTEPKNADKYLVKIDDWNSYISKFNGENLIKFLESSDDFWICNDNVSFRAIARKYMAIIIFNGKIFKKKFVILKNRKNTMFINLNK
ncbi:hypothetical protein [Aquimarina macrocephali]|uniref:hypothetical protein n=1 Tax=Aquimarina macrocephali TaxID=666563 RepID=UPI003F669E1E